MSKDFITRQELSIDNIVLFNDRIGRVVWIQQSEIGWIPEGGGSIEKAMLTALKPAPITPTLLKNYLAKIQKIKVIDDQTFEYETSFHTSKLITYRIEGNSVGTFITILDNDCAISATTLYYTKMHSLQNFITSIHQDIVKQ